MPAHGDELEEALGEGVTMRWLSTVDSASRATGSCSRRWSSTTTGFPEPTGEFEELDADSLVLALGQDTDLSLLDRTPEVTIDDGVVEIVRRP